MEVTVIEDECDAAVEDDDVGTGGGTGSVAPLKNYHLIDTFADRVQIPCFIQCQAIKGGKIGSDKQLLLQDSLGRYHQQPSLIGNIIRICNE